MDWIETEISTTHDGVEIISGVLIDCGISGFQIDDKEDIRNYIAENGSYWDYIDDDLLNDTGTEAKLIFYVTKDSYGHEILTSIQNRLDYLKTQSFELDLGSLCLEMKNVKDDDWLNNWKKYFKPFRIGEKIVIRPAWEPYDAETSDLVFNINSGNVFGTGLHQTTQMCAAKLEKTVKIGDKVADLGCGSGILSIIALMLGAEYAYACDIDPAALSAARENALLNNIKFENYDVEIYNILNEQRILEKNIKFDIVAANIVADVIIALEPIVPMFIRKGGIFIVSGIIIKRLEDVIAAYKTGWELLEIRGMDDWVLCVFRI